MAGCSHHQAGHLVAREHPRHLTQHYRRPLVPRQSAVEMEVEMAAPGANCQNGGGCDGGCESNLSLISIQTKDTGETLGIWNKRFQVPALNPFHTIVFNNKVTPLDHGNETISWFALQLFFCAKLSKRKFSVHHDASFISRQCDHLLQSCRFPSIHLDRLIPRDHERCLPDLESNRL
jgi:hypothetical protein